MQIGLLSDTHGFVDDKIFDFFSSCNEIWHAGDIGNIETANKLKKFKPLRAVHGNIDGQDVRIEHPRFQRFTVEQVDVLMTHIGGYPGHYDAEVKKQLLVNPSKLFICGHSHILKVIFDKQFQLLHINPGAAGISGFHKVRTAVRFIIDGVDIKKLEILEIQRNNNDLMP